ncbi:MAG: hypothetical protein IKI30_03230, partial [Oxalobacter sp.]|nr:hypothetical protein [Oxalobacter sp.]
MKRTLIAAALMAFAATAYAKQPVRKAPYKKPYATAKAPQRGPMVQRQQGPVINSPQEKQGLKPYEGGPHKGPDIGTQRPGPQGYQGHPPQQGPGPQGYQHPPQKAPGPQGYQHPPQKAPGPQGYQGYPQQQAPGPQGYQGH